MKRMKYFIIMLVVFSFVQAQESNEALAEKIKKVSEELLEGYTQPLITAFGTGISTGLFHSAYSHNFLGFDLGVRMMYIQIPSSAKFYSDTALACSLSTNNTLDYYDVPLDSINKIFGPKEETDVPVSGSAVAIPPYIPAGFDLSGVPLVMPQLNIGLLGGAEIMIRYIPFTFKGSKVKFLGLGAKEELTKLPVIKEVPFPLAVALGGAYQTFQIQDSLGETIVSSKTWNLQLLFSKRLVAFEPVLGVGLEGTSVNFAYNFEYEIPDSITGVPVSVSRDIDVTLHSQNHYRAMLGFNLRMGPVLLHYDINLLPYVTHDLILGISIR